MAVVLYRLGRFCARRPLVTVLAWVLILIAAGGAFTALQKPLSSTFTVPGAQFQKVLDEVGQRIPGVSGGVGTVVVHSDRRFTPAQERAIATTLADWKKIDHVKGAVDPFDTTKQQTDAGAQLKAGEAALESGRAQYEKGAHQLQQLTWLVGQGRTDIARLQQDSPDDATLQARIDGQKKLEKQLTEGRTKLADAQKQLASGEQQLQEGKALFQLSSKARFVSADGTTAIVQIQFDSAASDVPAESLEQIPEVGKQLEKAGVTPEYGVDIVHVTEVGGIGEIIGVVAAAIILVILLGSLVLAGLPLLNALFGVGVAIAIGLSVTHWTDLHQVAPVLGLMLGAAVGIDYGLFIVNRHRLQLSDMLGDRADPPSRDELRASIARATATAGNAVVVAGTTVFITLVAMFVTGIPAIIQMGMLGGGAVAVTVLVALTLTPAMLSLAGRRAVPKQRITGRGSEGWPARWFAAVTRRPAWTVAAVVVVLGIIALPATALRLGLPDGGQEQPDSTAYKAYTQIEKAFGPGANGPVLVVADIDHPVAKDQLQSVQLLVGQALAGQPYVHDVLPAGSSDDRRTLAFQVTPTTGPSAPETTTVVNDIQDVVARQLRPAGVELGVTGQASANIEISENLASVMPIYLVIVVGLSLVLLTLVFRSIVVPLVATAGYLLSAAASFGATVAVYQWGWLGPVFQVHEPGPIVSFLPLILIGVLFGLAMDYQMFLVTAMYEARQHGESALQAVRTGFTSGAKVVTAAALIMVSVFSGFIFVPMTMARPIGLSLAVGVLVDAFLIRMTLTPAVMTMLGDRAWYLPRWIDRLLPHLDVEGSKAPPLLPAAKPARDPEYAQQ